MGLVDSVRANLLKGSAATLDRLLKPMRVQHPRSFGFITKARMYGCNLYLPNVID